MNTVKRLAFVILFAMQNTIAFGAQIRTKFNALLTYCGCRMLTTVGTLHGENKK